jgi:hypothetical protein
MFEEAFRQRLLDLVYAQWSALGAPFVERSFNPHEVIDPEALLWCSLEFLPTEPRLAETVLEWLAVNDRYVVRQRVYRRRGQSDPRGLLWNALDPRLSKHLLDREPDSTPETCHGFETTTQVVDYARWIAEHRPRKLPSSRRVGEWQPGPATLLLRTRDVIGHDIRHFLLVYLLANPQGAKLREAQKWSGYSYRSLSDAASSWVAAEIATLESGHCRLTDQEPWRKLLHLRASNIIVLNWLRIFDISVRLLRDLAKARKKGIGEGSPVGSALIRTAAEQLNLSVSSQGRAQEVSLSHLRSLFPATA